MPEPIDLDEVLANNPQIDPDKLDEARELLRRLREKGVRPRGYGLAPPFGGRRAIAKDDGRADSRPLRARHPRGTG
jgi:hypothetical protein